MKEIIHNLEYIAKQILPEISIEEVYGSPTGVCCRVNEKGDKTIVWDDAFWDFFQKVLFVLDSLPYDELRDEALILELACNILGILFNHLSERFGYIPRLSATFRKLAIQYNYPIFNHLYPKAKMVSEIEEGLCK